MESSDNTENRSLHRSQSQEESSQPRILMAHSASVSSMQRRPETVRSLSLSTVIREIQPLVETARTVNAGVQNAISMSNFLHRERELRAEEPTQSTSADNSFVINLDDVAVNTNGNNGEQIEDNSNNNNEANAERLQAVLETQQVFHVSLKYVPFIIILLIKCVFDYHEGIFSLIVLFVTFAHSNSTVKKEATKRHRRGITKLLIELLYIIASAVFVRYIFSDEFHKYFNINMFREFVGPLTIGNLLWIVLITDFMLKLCTVSIKILLTLLPAQIVPFQKRGKIYLFIEAFSQLYRSLATIQPWLNYLLESYQGFSKILSVFLSAFYMISKSTDLLAKIKLMKTAVSKLMQNVAVGSSPTKEQIQAAGEFCPICHDGYESPVLLHCNHIFCENCVTTWFDREQTCPLCRAKIVDDPSWRDGSTTYFIQLY